MDASSPVDDDGAPKPNEGLERAAVVEEAEGAPNEKPPDDGFVVCSLFSDDVDDEGAPKENAGFEAAVVAEESVGAPNENADDAFPVRDNEEVVAGVGMFGFLFPQATHASEVSLLGTEHTSHFQPDPDVWLNTLARDGAAGEGAGAFGFFVPHATHASEVSLFGTEHTSHFQLDPDAWLNTLAREGTALLPSAASSSLPPSSSPSSPLLSMLDSSPPKRYSTYQFTKAA